MKASRPLTKLKSPARFRDVERTAPTMQSMIYCTNQRCMCVASGEESARTGSTHIVVVDWIGS